MLTRPRIAGITPREPIGAVLSVGIKSPDRGQPVEKDRFHILRSQAVGVKLRDNREVKRRDSHPDFAFYNKLSAETRRVFYGFLCHPNEADAFDWGLSAKVLPGRMPKKDGGGAWPVPAGHHRPACSSADGKTARRLYGIGDDGAHDWREIPCPNEGCEFRQQPSPACGPWSRLYFMPRWKDDDADREVRRPRPPMKWINHAWHSTRNVLGFFDYVATIAKGLGLRPGEYSLVGFPFRLDLTTQTRPGKQFPVVEVTPDGDPAEFFAHQRMQRQMAGGAERLLIDGEVVGAQDPEEIDALGEDLDQVTVPRQMEIK